MHTLCQRNLPFDGSLPQTFQENQQPSDPRFPPTRREAAPTVRGHLNCCSVHKVILMILL